MNMITVKKLATNNGPKASSIHFTPTSDGMPYRLVYLMLMCTTSYEVRQCEQYLYGKRQRS